MGTTLLVGCVALNVPLPAGPPMVQGQTTTRKLAPGESSVGEGTRVEVMFLYDAPTLWRSLVGADIQRAGPVTYTRSDGLTVSSSMTGSPAVVVRDFYRLGPGRYHAVYEVPDPYPLRISVPWNVDGKRFETQVER